MKPLGYLLIFQVAASIIAIAIGCIPFTNDIIKRQRLDAELRYSAETAACAAMNDPHLQKLFGERNEEVRKLAWDFIDSIEKKNAINSYVLLALLCSNLGMGAYLVLHNRNKHGA